MWINGKTGQKVIQRQLRKDREKTSKSTKDSRELCKTIYGKSYKNKASCTRYGKKKGCVWDIERNECYKDITKPTEQELKCFLKSYKLYPIAKKTIKVLQSTSFTVRYSRLGGIIDIRPKTTVNIKKLLQNMNKNKWWAMHGSPLSKLARGLDSQYDFEAATCRLMLRNYRTATRVPTVCRTLYGNMVKVKQLLKQIGSPYTIDVFNVEINYNGTSLEWEMHTDLNSGTKFYYNKLTKKTQWEKPPGFVDPTRWKPDGYLITSAIPDRGRCILAICSRNSGGFGHYMLAVLEGSTCYFFDSQNSKLPLALGAIKALQQQSRIKTFINLYTLNPDCYRTTKHQHANSMFCSVWSSCLALLIGLNPTKKVKDIFTYFAYKAASRKYLDQKIRLFLFYLLEKGAGKVDSLQAIENTNRELLYPMYNGKLCLAGPPKCGKA